ncbi:MAG: NAD(P)/FAD-dependent oxidoreductase [Verrucomicrobiales bacterium]
MLRLDQIRLPLDHQESDLREAVSAALQIPVGDIARVELVKRSVDARGRDGVRFSCLVDVELTRGEEALRAAGQAPPPDERYRQLDGVRPLDQPPGEGFRPIVVGSGPCGLFCTLLLARHGWRPLLIERGKAAGERARDVTGFWNRNWPFNPESNVQYGEGGAGTFSDGKLYTQIKDREHRIRWLLTELVRAGAPEDILTNGKPHIGTDRLIKVVRQIREEILSLGGEVRFEARMTKLLTAEGRVTGVVLASGETLRTNRVIAAVGHSARDTFVLLREAGVAFEAKPFSLGVRIEHPQGLINFAQYGRQAEHPALGAAPYKTVHHAKNGRAAYSFCMCPGGLVVAAASEPGGLVTNGMSSYARAEANANSGLMVDVRPEDFDGGSDPLAGIAFQRHWERVAFELGGSNFHAPVQRVGDFLAGRPSTGLGTVIPSYKPGVTPTDLARCLPDFVVETLREAIPAMARKLRGYDLPDAVLVGVETRSSSPVRMPRDAGTLQSISLAGFYPAGEGAGYAGGIISAAADGMKIAETILRE